MFLYQAVIVGRYIANRGVLKGENVKLFPFVNVPFPWQLPSDYAVENDCGVYMMLHMLFFVGDLFGCGLVDQNCRDLYRAEIAAILILSDLNESRGKILDKVKELKEQKELLLPQFVERRKVVFDRQGKESVAVEENVGERPLNEAEEENVDVSGLRICPITIFGSRIRGGDGRKSDGLGCTIDCGDSNSNILVVSNFLREKQMEFEKTAYLRKQVIDYCFVDGHDLKFE